MGFAELLEIVGIHHVRRSRAGVDLRFVEVHADVRIRRVVGVRIRFLNQVHRFACFVRVHCSSRRTELIMVLHDHLIRRRSIVIHVLRIRIHGIQGQGRQRDRSDRKTGKQKLLHDTILHTRNRVFRHFGRIPKVATGTFLDIGVGFITNQEVNPGIFLATIGQKTSMKLYPSMYNQLLEERPVAQSATTTNTKVDISSDLYYDGVNEQPRYHEELEEKVKKLMQLWSETTLEYRILKPKFLNRNCTLLESSAVPPKQYKAVRRGKNPIVNLKLHIVVLNIYSDNNNFICFSFG